MPLTRNHFILASRKSPLAMRQAEQVAAALSTQNEITVEIIGVSTRGDADLSRPLADIGGKELFIKGLQEEIVKGRADAAVHSLKDMAATPTPGFLLAAVGFAEDARDAVVSTDNQPLAALPAGASVGTSSPRRVALLRRHYPQLTPVLLRGNIQRRLQAVESGACAAAVLAAAGLKRMGVEHRISEYLSPTTFIPAIGQGLLAVECRTRGVAEQFAVINDGVQMRRACAERAFSARMGGDCHTPLGAHAVIGADGGVQLRAFYCAPTGQHYETETQTGGNDAAEAAGEQAAAEIIRRMQ